MFCGTVEASHWGTSSSKKGMSNSDSSVAGTKSRLPLAALPADGHCAALAATAATSTTCASATSVTKSADDTAVLLRIRSLLSADFYT